MNRIKKIFLIIVCINLIISSYSQHRDYIEIKGLKLYADTSQNQQKITETQVIENKKNLSFDSLITTLSIRNIPLQGCDTDIVFRFQFLCNTPSQMENCLQKLTAYPSKFLSYYGSYCTSRLNVIKGMDVKGIPIIFYMNGQCDFTRSLVFAVLDSVGHEISSKVLVTDDRTLKEYDDTKNKPVFKTSIYKIKESTIEVEVFTSHEDYGDTLAQKSYLIFTVDKNGRITNVK